MSGRSVREMRFPLSIFRKEKDPAGECAAGVSDVIAAHLRKIADAVDAIETEMRRIGYWQPVPPAALNTAEPYSGVSFEAWLQFVFLPGVHRALKKGDMRRIPAYRVGVAALRQYDYHSSVPEAHALMSLCFELERLLPPLEELKGERAS